MSTSPGIPAHIAIVMDGNGRWAKKRHRPRQMGHRAGQKALRTVVEHCVRRSISTLTVFAFSSENWRRPAHEISSLMELFIQALDKEAKELHQNGVCLRFIGDKTGFKSTLQEKMLAAEALTASNIKLVVNIAANYGGRWDITQAAKRMTEAIAEGKLAPDNIDEQQFGGFLALAGSPDPDLFIRTGGEMRISNFLLWQSAYTEFYFTPVLWPDFNENELDQAIAAFRFRERRFGHTSEQLKGSADA